MVVFVFILVTTWHRLLVLVARYHMWLVSVCPGH